jgi:tripartite-type tricarboxylate transporter receptor subunit TctC
MLRVAVAAWCLLAAFGAGAQAYPAKPVRMIVTFAAGGSSDVLARAVGKFVGDGLGQQVVVENRPGAGGRIGAEAAAKAPADGYTLLFGTIGTHGVGPALFRNLPFDPIRDFAPIGLLHKLPNLLVVHPSVGVSSVRELISLAKAQPGKLTFASAGAGTVSHLSAELFKSVAGVDIVHVPYKGGGAAVPDVLAGTVSMMFETIPTAIPHARSGKLRALAVTTATRSQFAPDVPPVADALPGYEVSSWTGLFAPAGTPPAIVARLNSETVRITRDPAYLEAMKTIGTDAVSSTPAELAAFVREEIAKWQRVAQAAGVKPE